MTRKNGAGGNCGAAADRLRRTCAYFLFLLVALLPAFLGTGHAAAQGAGLERFVAGLAPGELVPGADRLGQVEAEPRLVRAFRGDELAGYVFLNSDYVNSVGYSGKPIDVLVGIDPEGTILGAKLVEHHEPIVLVGIPEQKVVDAIAGVVGYNPLRAVAEGAGPPRIDIVSGATVTVLVMAESITRSAARVARALRIGGAGEAVAGPKREVDPEAGTIEDWTTLLGDGSIRRLSLTVGDVNDAFARSGNERAASRPERGEPDEVFIDLYAALVSQPAIGRSLLGEAEYNTLARMLAPGQHAILVAGEGRYSFKGSGYVRGGIFDRIELVQGTETIRFRDRLHRRVGDIAADGAPAFREIGIFLIPTGERGDDHGRRGAPAQGGGGAAGMPDVEFDPAEPWELKLLVQRATGALDKAFVAFALPYQLPEKYLAAVPEPAPPPAPAEAAPAPAPAGETAQPSQPAAAAPTLFDDEDEGEPLWVRIWRSKAVAIGVLVAMLGTLTGIFFFQDLIVRHEKLYDRIRLAYLAVTLFWLGWVAQAQLSVVNVLTFASALRTDFQWSYFLMDPLVFILWFSVAAALLFWGRGPFCGWLCPFGALQELSNRAAKALRVPQLKIPWAVHERLWPVKYMIFLLLFGVALGSLAFAERLAEIEPFKTAIILRFMREWWFVAFALGLLFAGLFVERFFCRYLCPLGAALAIPGRMRMFDWLKRYRECGNPCMRCFKECPVEAIHPEGHINPNECISCLHCQVLYHHEQKCPVVIQRRIRREKLQGQSAKPTGAAGTELKLPAKGSVRRPPPQPGQIVTEAEA
ncbi:4Fe-4S binding protein [Faunimonas sp. B44]|uniref:4Fe-4S binding protein n=1 Tax=Faunimonas sp. B44 TaxID=3461493 RepID=UPI004044F89D